jgi:hypothetical protein
MVHSGGSTISRDYRTVGLRDWGKAENRKQKAERAAGRGEKAEKLSEICSPDLSFERLDVAQ